MEVLKIGQRVIWEGKRGIVEKYIDHSSPVVITLDNGGIRYTGMYGQDWNNEIEVFRLEANEGVKGVLKYNTLKRL